MSSLKNMDKEQQQLLIIAGIVVFAVIYGVWEYGFTPIEKRNATITKKLKKLKKQVSKDKSIKNSAADIKAALKVNKNEFNKLRKKFVPMKNSIIWGPRFLGKLCDKVGISEDKRSIACTGVSQSERQHLIDKLILPYELNITLKCGYHYVGKFMAELENEYPFVEISSLKISKGSRGGDVSTPITKLAIVIPQLNEVKLDELKKGLSL